MLYGSAGTVVEWFDYGLDLYLVPAMAPLFFPSSDPIASAVASLTFQTPKPNGFRAPLSEGNSMPVDLILRANVVLTSARPASGPQPPGQIT